MKCSAAAMSCVLFSACAAPLIIPVQPLGDVRPDPSYWRSVACDAVVKRYQKDCISEHERMGISPYESQGFAEEKRRAESQPPPPPPKTFTPEEMEVGRAAVDLHLASTLKDPLSAMQYRVSDIVLCGEVLPAQLTVKPDNCICYEVNAKNGYGGYTGGTLGIVELLPAGQTYIGLDLPHDLITAEAVKACYSANLSPRDAELIKKAVR